MEVNDFISLSLFDIQHSYKHSNLVKPIALLRIDQQWCFITEYASNGNLTNKLKEKVIKILEVMINIFFSR